jgi:hypothetical protein
MILAELKVFSDKIYSSVEMYTQHSAVKFFCKHNGTGSRLKTTIKPSFRILTP